VCLQQPAFFGGVGRHSSGPSVHSSAEKSSGHRFDRYSSTLRSAAGAS
jgi:hypothetical protein